MARWDTTQLANTVIRDAKVPAGSSYRDNSNEKLLAVASEEQEATVVPELIKVQGNHLLAYEDTTLVAGTSRYRFPDKAIRPERVAVVNSEGKLISRLPLASGDMVDEVLAGFFPRGDAIGYWVPENNHAVVALRDSVLQTGYTLRTFYRRQPNTLAVVNSTQGGTITTVALVNGNVDVRLVVTVGSIANGATFTTSATGQPLDVIDRRPPFEALGDELTPDSVVDNLDGTVRVQFPVSSFATLPVAGDYVYLAGYTPAPQLPVAIHAVLAAFTTARVLREMGNKAAGAEALLAAERKLESALTTITPRGDDAETVVDEVWLARSDVW